MLAWEKIKIQNSKYSFYLMCITFTPSKSQKILSGTIVSQEPSVMNYEATIRRQNQAIIKDIFYFLVRVQNCFGPETTTCFPFFHSATEVTIVLYCPCLKTVHWVYWEGERETCLLSSQVSKSERATPKEPHPYPNLTQIIR